MIGMIIDRVMGEHESRAKSPEDFRELAAGGIHVGERGVEGHAGRQRGGRQVERERPGQVALQLPGPGQFGEPGRQQVAAWTSVDGTSWASAPIGGLTGPQTGGSYQISALAPSGTAVTGIGSLATQASQEVFTVTLPAR